MFRNRHNYSNNIITIIQNDDISEGFKGKGYVKFSETNYRVRSRELGVIHFNNN